MTSSTESFVAELTDRIAHLETLLRHVQPVLAYVSRGKGYTAAVHESYPDAAARRLSALVQDALQVQL